MIAGWLLTAALFSLPPTHAASANARSNGEAAKSARLMWKTNTISIALSPSLLTIQQNIKFDTDILGAVRRSLTTWESVANIKFVEVPTEKLAVSPAGQSGDGVSLITVAPAAENLLLFGEDASEISAKTRVFYNRKGIITEADIALNPYVQFSTDGTVGSFDLEATLTHEIGHLLGLEHSHLPGATMQAHQGKNGIYNLQQTASRTLSESDIANVRALYGAPAADVNCCGIVKGKITLKTKETAAVEADGFQLWLEDAKTGKVHAGTMTKSDGTFSLEGLAAGKYRVFAQDTGEKSVNRKQVYSGGELGEINVEAGKTAVLEKQLSVRERSFSLNYVGFNGQISNISVAVNSGKSFVIYLGGKNLHPEQLTVAANSPYVRITPDTTNALNFGEEISALSFEVSLKPGTPAGEYSLRVQNKDGETAYFIGGLSNDSVINPWSSWSFNIAPDFE